MNILIVKLSAIGDVIHTLPSLAALRRCHPGADITWVVEEAAADLLAGHPDLDRVIVSRRKHWIREIRCGRIAAPLREMRAFYRDLRARRYDLVIDFHGLLKSAVIVLLSGGKRKLGYDSFQEGSGLFYSEKIPEAMGKHAVDRYLDFVRHVAGGAEAACPGAGPGAKGAAEEGGGLATAAGDGEGPFIPVNDSFRIALGEEQERRVTTLLDEQRAILGGEKETESLSSCGKGGPEPPFVAVNPVAFWETKLWEDQKFAELCDRITGELGIGVVLTGGEAGPLDRIKGGMKRAAVNLGGRTTLKELACLYRRACLVITTDSGPMHLAAAIADQAVFRRIQMHVALALRAGQYLQQLLADSHFPSLLIDPERIFSNPFPHHPGTP